MTQILRAIDEGDSAAASELLPVVYAELRQLAQHRLANEAPGHTLQATALVHEAYLRLVHVGDGGEDGVNGSNDKEDGVAWDGRAHFFAAAAEAMRRILIDHARAKGAVKRGGGGRRLTMPCDLSTEPPAEELLDLNEALDALAREDHAKAELVKLRFFAGLTMQQAADLLGISRATANRHWTYARAWLYGEMRRDEENLQPDETSHNEHSH